ncbi:MAG: SDR family oxidoreductase [Flavobacteriales bacterium]|nr:SDR family oxidoreductase [Flavobacteriales bacterium]NQX97404.1 SDR family oxidoreductase [Flavobacteriales bacterium]
MNILITGASKGIGFEVVKQFTKNTDNKIIALSRDKELLQNLKKVCETEFNNKIYVHSIDFLSNSLSEDLDKILLEHKYHFDIIINNAGYLINKPFSETTKQEIRNTYQTNVFAPITILQAVFPLLDNKKHCHIINIGSMGGYQGSVKFPGLSIYSSSKAALANLTECLAEEYKEKQITINCLALGSVQTEMLNNAFPDYKAQVTATEMAMFIANFALTQSNYFNGKVIPISKTTP